MPAKKTAKSAATKKTAAKIIPEAAPGVPMVEKRSIIKTEEGPVLPIEENRPTVMTKEHRIEPLTLTADEANKPSQEDTASESASAGLSPVKLPIEEDAEAKSEPSAAATPKRAAEETASAPSDVAASKPESAEEIPVAPKNAPEPAVQSADEKPTKPESKTDESPKTSRADTPAAPADSQKDLFEEGTPSDTPDDLLAGDDGVHPLDAKKSKADQEAIKRQQELEKLVESETYFLPLNSVEKRRLRQAVLVFLLLIMVLALAAVAWAASANLIDVPGLS